MISIILFNSNYKRLFKDYSDVFGRVLSDIFKIPIRVLICFMKHIYPIILLLFVMKIVFYKKLFVFIKRELLSINGINIVVTFYFILLSGFSYTFKDVKGGGFLFLFFFFTIDGSYEGPFRTYFIFFFFTCIYQHIH